MGNVTSVKRAQAGKSKHRRKESKNKSDRQEKRACPENVLCSSLENGKVASCVLERDNSSEQSTPNTSSRPVVFHVSIPSPTAVSSPASMAGASPRRSAVRQAFSLPTKTRSLLDTPAGTGNLIRSARNSPMLSPKQAPNLDEDQCPPLVSNPALTPSRAAPRQLSLARNEGTNDRPVGIIRMVNDNTKRSSYSPDPKEPRTLRLRRLTLDQLKRSPRNSNNDCDVSTPRPLPKPQPLQPGPLIPVWTPRRPDLSTPRGFSSPRSPSTPKSPLSRRLMETSLANMKEAESMGGSPLGLQVRRLSESANSSPADKPRRLGLLKAVSADFMLDGSHHGMDMHRSILSNSLGRAEERVLGLNNSNARLSMSANVATTNGITDREERPVFFASHRVVTPTRTSPLSLHPIVEALYLP
eukprot:g23283.t1